MAAAYTNIIHSTIQKRVKSMSSKNTEIKKAGDLNMQRLLRLFSPTTMFLVVFDPSLVISVLTFSFGLTLVVMYDVASRLLLLYCRPFILVPVSLLLGHFLSVFMSSCFEIIRSYYSLQLFSQVLFSWCFHTGSWFFPMILSSFSRC